jgi:FkbM family methyltransferase
MREAAVPLRRPMRRFMRWLAVKRPCRDLIMRNEWLSDRLGARLVRLLESSPPSEVTIRTQGARLTVPWMFVRAYFPEHEPGTVRWMKDYLQAGSVAIDVGAHIGYFTVLMARLAGRYGAVYALEPAQDNLQLLQRNVNRNRLRNVTVIPSAAGNKSMVRELRLGSNSDGYGFYTPEQATRGTVPVAQVRLDDLSVGPVDLIKIDVEGAELDVLEGMTEILSRNPSVSLIVEWSPLCLRNAGHSTRELPDYLHKLGFKPIVVDDRSHGSETIEEVFELLDSSAVAPFWYCNLICERRSGAGENKSVRTLT